MTSLFLLFILIFGPFLLLWFIKKLVVSAVKEIKDETKKIDP